MNSSERDVSVQGGFDEKRQKWESATPDQESLEMFPTTISDAYRQMGKDLYRMPLESARLWIDFNLAGYEAGHMYRELKRDVEPRGDGSTVAIFRGWGGPAAAYGMTQSYLERDGYNTLIIGKDGTFFNTDPIADKKDKHWNEARDIVQKQGRKLHGLGHSQGAIELGVLYAEHPYEFEENFEDVWHLAGARPIKVNSIVGLGYLWAQLIHRGGNDAKLQRVVGTLQELEAHGHVPLHSIYNSSDAVLPDGIPIGVNHPNETSHIGAALNPRNMDTYVSSISSGNSRTPSERLAHAA